MDVKQFLSEAFAEMDDNSMDMWELERRIMIFMADTNWNIEMDMEQFYAKCFDLDWGCFPYMGIRILHFLCISIEKCHTDGDQSDIYKSSRKAYCELLADRLLQFAKQDRIKAHQKYCMDMILETLDSKYSRDIALAICKRYPRFIEQDMAKKSLCIPITQIEIKTVLCCIIDVLKEPSMVATVTKEHLILISELYYCILVMYGDSLKSLSANLPFMLSQDQYFNAGIRAIEMVGRLVDVIRDMNIEPFVCNIDEFVLQESVKEIKQICRETAFTFVELHAVVINEIRLLIQSFRCMDPISIQNSELCWPAGYFQNIKWLFALAFPQLFIFMKDCFESPRIISYYHGKLNRGCFCNHCV